MLLVVIDLIGVFSTGGYPFGSAFFRPLSVYHSRTSYIIFNSVWMICLVFLIFFAFKQRWRMFYLLLIINSALFIYPMVTNEN